MRKRTAMLLAVCMMSSSVYFTGINEVYAAEIQDVEIVIEDENENLEATSTEEDENGFVIEDGVLKKYTGIGGEVVIPDGVTSIGDYAFSCCTGLKSIKIPDSVISIGRAAFNECDSLEDIEIPMGVTSIGDGAFSYCTSLKSVNIPDSVMSIGDCVFGDCRELADIEIPDSVMSIGHQAFAGCSSLTSIEIPDSVTSVGQSAFEECSSLTSVYISTNVTSIEAWLFAGCSSLTSIEIPENVTSISIGAFQNCSSLTSIELPDSVMLIGESAFSGCKNLESVILPASMDFYASYGIGEKVFSDCSSLNNIKLPEGTTEIRNNTFSGCSSLKNIDMPSSVKSIASEAFYGCSSLENIDMPSSVTSIASAAFYGCSSLNEVVISDGVTTIGANAFRNCSNLTKIGIPDSVTSIGAYAFDGCNAEVCIYCDDGSYVKTYAVENELNYAVRKNQKITASDFKKTIGDEPFSIGAVIDGNGVLTYESSDESVVSVSADGIATIHGVGKATITITLSGTAEWKEEQKNIEVFVYSEDGFCIGSGYYYDESLTVLEKREGVLYAYRGNAEEVIIPDNVYIIEAGAFSGCDTITSIDIHKNIETISATAFDNCINLKAINVEEVDENYADNSIIYRSFDGVLYSWKDCFRCPEGKEGNVEIQSNTSRIRTGAFLGCNKLTSINILGERTSILNDAFEGCADEFYIECLKGSYAETYAIENGLNYVSRKQYQRISGISDIIVTIGDEPYDLYLDIGGKGVVIVGELTFASSDETVVTVSEEGMLDFVGVGTAEITVTASETDEYYEAQKIINVTVNDKQNEEEKTEEGKTTGGEEQKQNEEQKQEVEKKEQTISAKNVKKTYGAKAFSIGAKTDGGGTLTYSIENKKIAQVDQKGKVTIKGCGVTNIIINAAENGEYNSATKTITLKVVPKKATLTSVKSTKTKTITVKWKKDSKASGYIIEYSTDKNFKKNVKKITISKNKTTSKKISKLKAGKKYYVRVCAYTVSNRNKIKGAYSKTKMVKVKK